MLLENHHNVITWLENSSIGKEILVKEKQFVAKNYQPDSEVLLLSDTLFYCLDNPNIINLNQIDLDIDNLPFATDSIDYIIIPHLLECVDYHKLLKELYRILKPNARIIIFALNKKSWLGLNQVKKLKNIKPVNLTSLKQELKSNGFRIIRGEFINYLPPIITNITRYDFLNKIGDRWFPDCANSFALLLTKDILSAEIHDKSCIVNPIVNLNGVIATNIEKEVHNEG